MRRPWASRLQWAYTSVTAGLPASSRGDGEDCVPEEERVRPCAMTVSRQRITPRI